MLVSAARRRPALAYAALLAVAIATGAGSCERDVIDPMPTPEPEPPTKRANVDERLLEYFDRYEAEAELRGITVDLSAFQLTGYIREIEEDGVAGECTYDPNAPNRLVVDEELWYGENTSDLLKEYVVFHELGHCERLRGHREDENRDGRCVSLMASGTGGCRAVYSSLNREEILDELFNLDFYEDGF